MPGHGHLFEQQGAGFVGAAVEGVVGGAGDVGQHVLQAAGDGDFLHGVGDLAVFHPKAGGAARVVAGEGVDALAHEFGNEQAAAHFAQEIGLALVGVAEDEVVGAAGVGGGGQAEFAGAVAAEEVALDDAVFNHEAGAGGDAFGIEGGAGQGFGQVRLQEIEQIEYQQDKSLDLTVYVGRRKGRASTADFSPAAIADTVRAALDIARYTAEDPCAGLAEAALMATEFPDLQSYHEWPLSTAEAAELARRSEAAARAADSRITNSEGAHIQTGHYQYVYGNSHGFMQHQRSSRHSLSCRKLVWR